MYSGSDLVLVQPSVSPIVAGRMRSLRDRVVRRSRDQPAGICEAVVGTGDRPFNVLDDVDRAGLPSIGDRERGGDAADPATDAGVSVVPTALLSPGPGPRRQSSSPAVLVSPACHHDPRLG